MKKLVPCMRWMGSVSHGLGADLSLPPCLSVTIGIWTLVHKSDPRAEISGEIVRYDALAPRPQFCCLCVLFAHAQAPFNCVLFAHAQAPSNSGSYYIQGNEMNCEGSSEYMIMFMSFTRASFLTYRRISHLVGWSELRFQKSTIL